MSNKSKIVINVGIYNADTNPTIPVLVDAIDLKLNGVTRTILAHTSTITGIWAYKHDSIFAATNAIELQNVLNAQLPTNYLITRSGAEITIEAKNYGAAGYYDFNNSFAAHFIDSVTETVQVVSPLGASSIIAPVDCGEVDNGAIDISVTGGAPIYPAATGAEAGYTYLWSDGNTDADRTGLADGTYSVTITDAIGNNVILSNLVITSKPPIVITGVVTNATGGGSNGGIAVTTSGGTGTLTFAWGDGPTTEDRTLIASGEYTITVTDADGCTLDKVFNVADDASTIVITETLTHLLCNGAGTGAIALVITGGTGPYTFLWNDGATVEDRTDLPAGTYNVWVTDSLGSIQTEEFIITEPTALVVTAAVAGDVIDLTVSGGVGPYTYSWSSGETTQDITVPIGGPYTVTVTDDNGCVKEVTVNVPHFVFYFSENPIELELELTSAYGTYANESFVLEVWVEKVYDSSVFVKVLDIEQPADTDGKTVFDVQDTIHAYLKATLPTWENDSVELATGHFIRFYLKHAEKYSNPPEDPPAVQSYTQANTFYAVLGGLSDLEHAADTFKDSYLSTVKPFFTWEPLEQEVYDNMQLYLHFMVNAFSLGAIELHGKVTYTDDTTTGLQLLNQIASTKRFELYRVPVGYTQLALAAINPAKEVVKYEVWMQDDSANVISEIRRFEVVDRPYYSRLYFYLNSMGGWSTLKAEGYAKGKMRVTETTLQQKLESGYAVTDTEVEVVKKSGQQQLAISAIPNDNVFAAHIQDFAISRKVFELTDTRFEPVRIGYNPDYFDEEENVVPFEFVVLPPVMKKFTPKL